MSFGIEMPPQAFANISLPDEQLRQLAIYIVLAYQAMSEQPVNVLQQPVPESQGLAATPSRS